jgi:NADH-quinone oxidoreductase subunit M
MDLGFPILTAIVLLPAFGALAVALVPRARSEVVRDVAVLFSVATGALTLWLLGAFDRHDPAFQFETNRSWVADFGISWHVGVDGISLFLVVLTGILFPIALLATTPQHDAKPYYAWLLLLEAGCLGVFVSASWRWPTSTATPSRTRTRRRRRRSWPTATATPAPPSRRRSTSSRRACR